MNKEQQKEQLREMNSDRIKEIQAATPYPNSVSVGQALLQVWNECQQFNNTQLQQKEAELTEAKKEVERSRELLKVAYEAWSHDDMIPLSKQERIEQSLTQDKTNEDEN